MEASIPETSPDNVKVSDVPTAIEVFLLNSRYIILLNDIQYSRIQVFVNINKIISLMIGISGSLIWSKP